MRRAETGRSNVTRLATLKIAFLMARIVRMKVQRPSVEQNMMVIAVRITPMVTVTKDVTMLLVAGMVVIVLMMFQNVQQMALSMWFS